MAVSILKAFRESKDRCYKRLSDPRQTALAWVQDLIEEQPPSWAPTPGPTRWSRIGPTLTALIRYSHAQGLIPTAPPIEELFAPNSLSESPRYVS